jgi:hypothetical protein
VAERSGITGNLLIDLTNPERATDETQSAALSGLVMKFDVVPVVPLRYATG